MNTHATLLQSLRQAGAGRGRQSRQRLIAKCRACNAVFGFADLVGGGPERSDEPVPMPKCFVVENWGPELSLTRHWYSHALWIMVPFCILWDGFLIVWFSASFGVIFGQPDAWIAGVFMLLFSVLHVAVGVVMTYATLCGFMNRTVLRVSGGELTVRHGPLPFPGNRQVLTADIKQLYCTETIHRGKRSSRSELQRAGRYPGQRQDHARFQP